MALATVTVTYDLSDLVGTDFDARRTKVWATTNIDGDTVIDTVGNQIRLGDGKGTVADDGTGSITLWAPGTGSNPDSWQTYIHVDYPRAANRDRKIRTFGPFTITTNADLADLVEEQEVPPTYITTVTAALDAKVADAQAARDLAQQYRDQAHDISNISTPDTLVAALVPTSSGSATSSALNTAIDARVPVADTTTPGKVELATTTETTTGTDTVRATTPAGVKAALDAGIATPKWKATTAYAAGAIVLAPDNTLVKANTAFTSSASYNAANWTNAVDYEDGYATPLLPKYRMRPGYLDRWYTALTAVKNKTGSAKILCIGDSTTNGVGGGSESTFAQIASWPSYLASVLDGSVAATVHGLAVPPSLSTSIVGDTRWTFPTAPNGWQWRLSDALNAYVGLGGKGANVKAGPTATLPATFADSRIFADRFDVYIVETDSATGATFSFQATGGTAVTGASTGAAAKGIRKVTVNAATASFSNVLSMTRTGGTGDLYIVGIEPYLSTGNTIRVANAGVSGSDTQSWVDFPNANNTLTWNSAAVIKAYAPNLTIIDLGINDAGASRTSSAFMTNLNVLITAALVSGEVLIKTPIPANGRDALLGDYRSAVLGADRAVIDLLAFYGTHARMSTRGWKYDDLHGTDAGYRAVGRAVGKALCPEVS
jgi:lysophospholipase L1-like esterase